MTDIVFVFEVHQPHRLKRSLFWEGKIFRRQAKEELFNYYFDNEVDREIFKRAARKCYYPSNQIILENIDKHKNSRKQVKFSFSISGVFPKPNLLPLHLQPLSGKRRIHCSSQTSQTNRQRPPRLYTHHL